MASIRKRGSNSYLIVVSRGYDYEGNRLKSVQKTVKPPKEYTPKQAEKWVKEQAILFEREVQHTPEPINRSMTNVLTAFSCQRTFVIFYLLNSDITGGVVHNYAFSCIHRYIGCR